MPDTTTVANKTADSAAVTIDKVLDIKNDINHLNVDTLNTYIDKLAETAYNLALKVLLAVAIYIVGRWIIRKLKRICIRIFEKKEIDPSLKTFLISLINIALTIVLIITIISVLGIETSSFVALFASAGVAIGMALSGTLQNFAGGVMVLLFKPYRVGDVIEAQGYSGTVKEILIFNTILNTFDNKAIIIPNGSLATGIINNFSKESIRRIEWTFGIAYGDDFQKAREVIMELLKQDSRIKTEPAEPFVALSNLGTNSVNIVVRVWVDSPDFWPVYYRLNESVYTAFEKAGLNLPLPKMDIHIKKEY